jgi:hypothetical protein
MVLLFDASLVAFYNTQMTLEEAFNKIVLYFYLVTLNEKKTLELSIKASKSFQIRVRNKNTSFDADIAIVEICTHLLMELPRQSQNQLAIISPSFLNWPDHLDFIPWREFHKKSSSTECIAVIWVNILGISIHKLAQVLTTTEGTIRYRLNKGCSLLGQINRSSWGNA